MMKHGDKPARLAGPMIRSVFTEKAEQSENDAFNYIRSLTNWRKKQYYYQGSMKHFVPEVAYVYFHS